jgi:hypothetical protein
VTRWPLQPLLELRSREEERATARLAMAERAWQAVLAESVAAREEALGTAERALRAGTTGREPPLTSAVAHGLARFRERLRLEAARLLLASEEAAGRARCLGAEVDRRREALRVAAIRHEATALLGAAWRMEQATAAARKEEAALDDRPWPPGVEPGGSFSAARSAAARRAPGRTGW